MGKRLLKTATAGLVVASGIATICTNTAKADEVEKTPSDISATATVESTQTVYKTSEQAKAELDTQTGVVTEKENAVNSAQDTVNQAQTGVDNAQTAVNTANQAVTDAEKATSNATSEAIEANKSATAANLAHQGSNAKAIESTNAEITDATQAVTNVQTSVDSAQTSKDQADQAVNTAQTEVDNAQAELDATSTAKDKVQTELETATKDIAEAQNAITTAEASIEVAKATDEARLENIKTAETDVNIKTDAVENKRDQVTAAFDKVTEATEKVSEAQTKVDEAQKALANSNNVILPDSLKDLQYVNGLGETVNSYTLPDGTVVSGDNIFGLFTNTYKAYEQTSDETSQKKALSKLNAIGGDIYASLKKLTNDVISEDNTTVDLTSVTYEQQVELSQFVANTLNAINKILGNDNVIHVANTASIETNNKCAERYIERNKGISAGHIGLGWEEVHVGENMASYTTTTLSMSQLKTELFKTILTMFFQDGPSNWGHTENFTNGGHISVAFAPIQSTGETLVLFLIGTPGGKDIPTPDPTVLQANLYTAKAELTTATTSLSNAKSELAVAQAQYAAALELLTQAEKTLADAKATPLQTQVAENNLRLAQIALANAQERQAQAEQALANFTADLATKKATLDAAKAQLAEAKATQAATSVALETAKAKLEQEKAHLAKLEDMKSQLLAEKDRLVQEAKDLAAELESYTNAEQNLATAKANAQKAQTALELAQAQLVKATNDYNTVVTELEEAKAKQAELKAQYDQIVDFENNNVITILPDGTVIAVPKDAPTEDDLPEYQLPKDEQADSGSSSTDKNTGANNGSTNSDKQGNITSTTKPSSTVTKPQAGVTVTQTATGQKIAYSRVERFKALPETGEKDSSVLAFVGGIIATIGLAGVRRKRVR